MSYDDLIETSLWSRYSKKIAEKVLAARNSGHFTKKEAEERGMLCIEGRSGSLAEGNCVALYWLLDAEDGMIVDAKFQAFGQSTVIAAAEAACELVIGKNYDQAKRIGAELIDKKLRDTPDLAAFPEETFSHLNKVLEALEEAASKCVGIPLGSTYVSPIPNAESGSGYPGWLELSHEKKLAVIEEVLNEEIRPYVELDDGGIEVQELLHDRELIIAYKGSCTSCFSAIGATLSTIQQIVQTKVHPDIIVVPNMDALHL
jgi:NifU-like protein